MLIQLNLPEERQASAVWEIPILIAPEKVRVKWAYFVVNHAIWARGGIVRLTLLNRSNDQVQGFLTLETDLAAFQIRPFEVFGGAILSPNDVLTLIKEPVKERNLALPFCLVQVEIGQ